MSEFLSLKLNGNCSLRRFLVISFFYFAGLSFTYAQQQYSRFYHLTVNDGLSSNRIRCLYKDSKDYLWIATDVGLDKYDSYQVKKYRQNENQPGTITSNILTCIYEDHKKNLWFGTYDGLNLYNPSKDNFKVFKNSRGDSSSLNSNCITGIVEDKKGNIWIVSDGSCLNKLDTLNQDFIRYPFELQRHGLSVRPSTMAAVDSKGFIWIGSLSPGIIRFDPESGAFTQI
jgi:streptogramin lyase